MFKEFQPYFSSDIFHVGLVLVLSLFVGLEREEHKQREKNYSFGGIRTFPLIGLVSYALAMISAPQILPWAIGFAVVGGLMMLSYWHKLSGNTPAGLTTEMSALATYVVGGLVQYEHFWMASTIAVLSVLLLELKKGLEDLTQRFGTTEIVTVATFLVLSVVILPAVPNQELTQFHLNPFKIWLVVVAVNGVSFASYVLQRVFKERGGVFLSGALGGAYSSTITTIALSRQAKDQHRPNLFAGSILTASAVMYARLVGLIAFFDTRLALKLAPEFLGLALIGGIAGWVISRRDRTDDHVTQQKENRNPLELGSAILFALVFVVVLILTTFTREHLGSGGLYTLAVIMGVTDVDPFILGLAEHSTTSTPIEVAAVAILIATASNNVVKAIYSWSFADRETGRRCLVLLLGLAALGLLPLVWI